VQNKLGEMLRVDLTSWLTSGNNLDPKEPVHWNDSFERTDPF